MDGSGPSDFSIERILSPQLGLGRTEPQQHRSLAADPGAFRGPPPLLLQFGLSFTEPGFQYFRRPDFSCACSASGVHLHLREAPEVPLADHHGYCPAGVPAQAQLRQRARVRTVFTDAQLRQLEALFDLTDYPPAEARAQVAKRSGLSEETVRVWFKNRRARRKQQRSAKVKSSSSPCQRSADTKAAASVL
ncbi:homeobox protein goosecoid-2-like isoform X2 [Takifugu rubripes]|uniref:Dharma n=1 Tax=Takifugu rubripes TaxID=31033 RepID=A0A3B5KPV8_TAKRU|nr:homeobox protein goosecoid-2-like isoform X2 [Takifugu rubripes]